MLTNVINLVVNIDIMLLPAILALTYEASVLIIHAIVTPVSTVSGSASTSKVTNSSDLKHALIRSIELLAEHTLDIVLKGHALSEGSLHLRLVYLQLLLPSGCAPLDHFVVTLVLIGRGVIYCSDLLNVHVLG